MQHDSVSGWGVRGGRRPRETLPAARLVAADQWRVQRAPGPTVRIEGPDHGVIVFGSHEWLVPLDRTPARYGGYRRWLVCPRCGSRRQSLYVCPDPRGGVACMKCLGLRYESQHESRRQRLFRRADAIRRRLGWEPGVGRPRGSKPPRMHWSTYRKLVQEHDRLAARLLHDLSEWLDRFEALLDGGE